MYKLVCYVLLMASVVILLPMLIIKGCGPDVVEEPPAREIEEIRIKVYIASEDRVEDMYLEEYLKGVVAAEMPAEFETQALMAQAVAARTYAYGRMMKIYTPKDDKHSGADICTDSLHCQAWVSKADAIKKWSIFSAGRNWRKIENAVAETKDIIITYNGAVINPVYHSNSGGMTENAEEVWGGKAVPYLRSVPSGGEEDSPAYMREVSFKIADFCGILKKEFENIKLDEKDILKGIKILERTGSGRVKTIRVGNVDLKGTEFRRLFSLRSANFNVEKDGKDKLKITAIGNGHGVGMSQWGANYLAGNGATFEEIIKYYYTGVELDRIKDK